MTQSPVPTPYDQQKPADSGFRLEIVCHIHGVIRDSYAHEVIDAHPEHTEEVHQEKVVNDGRYCDTHILKKKIKYYQKSLLFQSWTQTVSNIFFDRLFYHGILSILV